MSDRQTLLYVHTVNIYKPVDLDFLSVRDANELSYTATPTYANVACYRNTKPEVTQDSYIGRLHASGTFVGLCEFSFRESIDVNTNYVLEFLTDSHPDEGEWFIILGNPKVKNRRANKLTVYAQRSIKPRLR